MDDPPELPEPDPLRRGFLTFARAQEVMAEHPEWKSLRGDLQMHSEHSDGKTPIAEMALSAAAYGYDYIAITDHSKGLKIAGGMTEEELALQGKEIDALNGDLEAAGQSFHVLKALEMNINPSGEGDMEPDSLEELDLVLGSFHSALRKTEDQTDRYVAALRNPQFNVLGHPRCRMFNFRAGLSADWRRVFGEAAANRKAIEINAHPNRQDVNVELLEIAREEGCMFSIGTDAHAPYELQFVWIAVAAAILADVPRERIINYMDRDALLDWAKGS
jgi:putative hydrolase